MANGKASVKLLFSVFFCVLLLGSVGCEKKAPPPSSSQPTYYLHTISFSGETFSNIAGWYTGSYQNWMIIKGANPELDAHRLRIGSVVRIPRSLMIKETPMTKAFIDSSRKVKEVPPSQTPGAIVPPAEVTPAAQVQPEEPSEAQVQPSDETAKEIPAVKEEATEPAAPPPPAEEPHQPVAGVQSSVAGPNSGEQKSEERTKTRDELLKELLEDY